MSDGAFLEEEQKLDQAMSDGAFLDVARRVPFSHGGSFRAVASHCWPEIVAVVERLRFEHDKHDEEDSGGLPCRGCERLEALDKKAKGL